MHHGQSCAESCRPHSREGGEATGGCSPMAGDAGLVGTLSVCVLMADLGVANAGVGQWGRWGAPSAAPARAIRPLALHQLRLRAAQQR